MTKKRLTSYLLLLLSGSLSVFWGVSLQRTAPARALDFKLLYFAARCASQQCDPYQSTQIERFFQAQERDRSLDSTIRRVETHLTYPPTIFSVVAPFALLPWETARVLWLIVSAVCLLIAAYLMWHLGAKYAPDPVLLLICFLIANCQIIFLTENAAGLAVSLCIIAAWCMVENRFVAVGVLCLALSLIIKPHDAGFVWLFFLLAGASHRKRAIQTLLLAVVLSVPAIVWISHVSPHWAQEWNSNLAITAGRGDTSDPGPSSVTGHTPNMIISLQTIFSLIQDEPHFYNTATYLVFAPLFLLWAFKVVRDRFSQESSWMAFAAIVPLTMLVTYHRPYDAKLLLLAIPACAMLWAKGGKVARWAFALTSAGVFFTADIPLGMIVVFAERLHLEPIGLMGKALTILLDRPAPLVLLAMSIFYLTVYLRSVAYKPASEHARLENVEGQA